MTFTQKCDGFVYLALTHADKDLYDLYNVYLQMLAKKGETLDHDSIIIDTAESARMSSALMKDFIMRTASFHPVIPRGHDVP